MKKLTSENYYEYIWRLDRLIREGKYKNWAAITPIVNAELYDDETEYRDESTYRKPSKYARDFYEAGVFDEYTNNNSYVVELQETIRELEREKIRFRDERRAWQKQNYTDARKLEAIEILDNYLRDIGLKDFHCENGIKYDNKTHELIVILSDLHIGATFDTYFGSFNSDIAKQRLKKYLVEVQKIAVKHTIATINVVCLGDQISGNIHKRISVTNKENTIEQIKLASEYIASFCYELLKDYKVNFYNVSGNHTRLEKKDDSLHDERLDDLIGWIVGTLLSSNENFEYKKEANLDIGITKFDVLGKNYIAVHGDYDNGNKTSITNLSMLIGEIPYAVLKGHMHYPLVSWESGICVVQSGSLAGSGDDYTIEKRLNGFPSQSVCVCSEKGIDCTYHVNLS